MSSEHPPAEAWIALIEGEGDAGERKALDAHAAGCPGCAEQRARLQTGFEILGARVRGSRAAPPLPLPAAAPPPPRTDPSRVARWRLPLSAAAVAAIALGAWLFFRPSGPAPGPRPAEEIGQVAWRANATGIAAREPEDPVRAGQEIATGSAERLGVRLRTGVEIACRSSTRVRADSVREIFIARGEVHVRIPPGAAGFAARTPHGRFVDLGTAFLLRVEGSRSVATVLKGRIRAESGGGAREAAEGEQAEAASGVRIDRASPGEAERAAAWVRESLLHRRFRSIPLPDFLDLVESCTPYRFEFGRPAAERVRLTASFSSASSEAIVEGLLQALEVPAERRGRSIRLQLPEIPRERR